MKEPAIPQRKPPKIEKTPRALVAAAVRNTTTSTSASRPAGSPPDAPRRTVSFASPKRPSAQNAIPSSATPANDSASDDRSAFPRVAIDTTAPSRIQPSTSSIAAAVIEVRPMRVRVKRVWIRMRPMMGIAVIETAVAKKRRNASSGAPIGVSV